MGLSRTPDNIGYTLSTVRMNREIFGRMTLSIVRIDGPKRRKARSVVRMQEAQMSGGCSGRTAVVGPMVKWLRVWCFWLNIFAEVGSNTTPVNDFDNPFELGIEASNSCSWAVANINGWPSVLFLITFLCNWLQYQIAESQSQSWSRFACGKTRRGTHD